MQVKSAGENRQIKFFMADSCLTKINAAVTPEYLKFLKYLKVLFNNLSNTGRKPFLQQIADRDFQMKFIITVIFCNPWKGAMLETLVNQAFFGQLYIRSKEMRLKNRNRSSHESLFQSLLTANTELSALASISVTASHIFMRSRGSENDMTILHHIFVSIPVYLFISPSIIPMIFLNFLVLDELTHFNRSHGI